MNAIPAEDRPASEGSAGFAFFPAGMKHTPGEGRDPRVPLDHDPLSEQLPTVRQITFLLFAISLALYLASMSWTAFPGLPTWSLLAHLDPNATPTPVDSLWGFWLKGFARLPVGSVAAWSGLFSALCGAASVGLLARLMMRVGYLIRNEPGRKSFVREAQARRLSGIAAGSYLACNIPFWVASTRSLPATFHLLLLLAFAWFVSQYQHWGKGRHLFLIGLFFGVGASEFPTFLVFLPLAAFVVVREMIRWRALRSWRPHAALWGGLALGLLFYPLDAYVFFKQSALAGAYVAPWAALKQMLGAQILLITQIRYSPGFLAIIAVSVVPWLTLFTMSSRSPWFYEWGQIGVRLIFACGLIAILYDASFAPWNLLGMGYLMVTPYLMLAVCMGYVAGEFWILGESQMMMDTALVKRTFRRSASLFALLLVAGVWAGGAFNWRTVDGRYGRIVDLAVSEILGRLNGRDILFSTGLLDDSIGLSVLEDKLPVRVVSAPRTPSITYLQQLAKSFEDESWRQPLMKGDFGNFMDNLLMSDRGPSRVAIIDMPDAFREFGYLEPDGFLYRLETTPAQIDLPALAQSQKAFGAWMEQAVLRPVPEKNLLRLYQDVLRLMASRVANNLAILQIERGEAEAAIETLRGAYRIFPENLSVLMNLVELGRTRDLPEAAEWEKTWADRQDELGGERWGLIVRFGYVWNAREWVRRGYVWALSGVPAAEEAARRKPAISEEDEASNDNREQVLDQAYLLWGEAFQDDSFYRGRLMKDGRDTAALLALCRLSLRRNDPEAAEAYLAEALAVGLAEEKMAFDRAMLAYVRGEKDAAVDSLAALSRLTPGDMRVWMALLLLADENDPVNAEALKALKGQSSAPVGVHLTLAFVHMSRQQWAAAQSELDLAVQLDPRNTQAWEMMVLLAQARGNKPLLDAGLRALLERNPDHFLQYQNAGVEQYQKGNLAAAETAFRKGLQRQRDATLLNNLAHVITEQDGNLQDALKLIDEALLRQPGQAQMLSTRGAILVKLGRFEEARRDLQESLRKQGRKNSLLLLLAQTYEGLGDRTRALTLAKTLASQADKLDAKQKKQVEDMLPRLAEPPPPPVASRDWPEALEQVDAALRKTPGKAELLGARGAVLVQLGRFAEARQDLQAALKKQGRNSHWLILLAQAYEGSGDRARALKIGKALAAQPDLLNEKQTQQVRDLLLRLR